MTSKQFLFFLSETHVIIRAKDEVLPRYLQIALVSKNSKEELLKIVKTSSTREALTKIQLENFKIPLPSLETQKAIVTKIEALEAKINEAKKAIEESKAKKEAILKRYW